MLLALARPLTVLAIQVLAVGAGWDDGREPAARTPAPGERIAGRVESDRQLPPEMVLRATVHLRDSVQCVETTVAPDGTFSLALPPGAVWGWLDLESPTLQLHGAVFEPGWMEIVLQPRFLAAVEGRVRASAGRRLDELPMESWVQCGPLAVMRNSDMGPSLVMANGAIGADGWFRLEDLPTDRPMTLTGAHGRARGSLEVLPLAPGEVRTVELALFSPGTVRGRVEDESFAPVENALVSLYTAEEWPQRHARSAADGTFELPDVEPGRWAVEARAIGFDLARRELVLGEDETVELCFTLGPPAIVRGEVLYPDGTPFHKAIVCEADIPRRRYPDFASSHDRPSFLSGRSGHFGFQVHTGAVQVVAGAPGWAPSAPFALELAPGEVRAGLVLVLREPARLMGRLLDPLGQAPPPTTLALTYPDGTVVELGCLGGTFEASELPPGRARLATLSWPELWSASAEVELVARATTEVELRLGYR